MSDLENAKSEFLSFRVLKEDGTPEEYAQLFGHLAKLFSFVSERCDDEQVAQYDHVLCQLADLVEKESRVAVSLILSQLERAPGGVVVRLARDEIEVAQPLLEFSKVLSDDDLIEIIAGETEAHRISIAARPNVGERVGDAIIQYGSQPSMARLIHNHSAVLSPFALEKVVAKAANDTKIAEDLRSRKDIDWKAVENQVGQAAARVLQNLEQSAYPVESADIEQASALVYARMKNRAGFNARDWKTAWNQVKALNDRRQLNKSALSRFSRFGYGHHVACGLTIMMNIPPEVFVKWLSTQDYVAATVALKAMGLDQELIGPVFNVLPWRDAPTAVDISNVTKRFETLGSDEARSIFRLWRSHAFRRKTAKTKPLVAVA